MFNVDEATRALTKEVDEQGISEYTLDDLVIEVTDSIAAGVNNKGISGQITYILKHMGPMGVRAIRERFKDTE